MVASTAFAEFLREQLAPLNYMKHGSAIDLSFWRAPDRSISVLQSCEQRKRAN